MSRLWELEDFDGAEEVGTLAGPAAEAALEEERLRAFDNGYKAGWEDAAKAHAEEQAHISSELAQNLQALSFTYHEARDAVLTEMEGILSGLIDRVLPATMASSLGQMIHDRVLEVMEKTADVDVEIVVCPENVERVRALLDGMVAPPLNLSGEASLGEGQAFLRIGGAETKIDLESVFRDLSGAVTEFFEPRDETEVANG